RSGDTSCRDPTGTGAAPAARTPEAGAGEASSQRRHRVRDLGGHAIAHRLGSDLHGVRDGARRRAAVTLDEELLEAEDRRATVLRVIGQRAQALDRAREEPESDAPREPAIARDRGDVVQHLGDPLEELQDDVADEPLADDYVRPAAHEVVPFDVPDEVHLRQLAEA